MQDAAVIIPNINDHFKGKAPDCGAYEIGEELKSFPNISFQYFETIVRDEQLEFSYQLKEGISNDRIGYVILKREKVVDMLEKL